MTGNVYQFLAARTMNKELTWKEQGKHALHGMVGEIGELHSIYQKKLLKSLSKSLRRTRNTKDRYSLIGTTI